MSEKEISEIVKYALFYLPRVRALLGAILENLGETNKILTLKESLNPLTKIKIGLKKQICSQLMIGISYETSHKQRTFY